MVDRKRDRWPLDGTRPEGWGGHDFPKSTVRSRPTSVLDPRRRPLRILIIDDDPDAADAIALAFEGETVRIEHDPAAGVGLAAQHDWDLILCDMMMPGMTGQDVYEALSGTAPARLERVVFVTGGGFTPKIQAFLAQTGPKMLSKPASLDELRALIA